MTKLSILLMTAVGLTMIAPVFADDFDPDFIAVPNQSCGTSPAPWCDATQPTNAYGGGWGIDPLSGKAAVEIYLTPTYFPSTGFVTGDVEFTSGGNVVQMMRFEDVTVSGTPTVAVFFFNQINMPTTLQSSVVKLAENSVYDPACTPGNSTSPCGSTYPDWTNVQGATSGTTSPGYNGGYSGSSPPGYTKDPGYAIDHTNSADTGLPSTDNFVMDPNPEPASLILLGTIVGAVGLVGRRRSRKQTPKV